MSQSRSTDPPEVAVSGRILTVPNLITGARICLIPIFAWVFLSGKADLAAFWLLVVLGGTDWVDGLVARRTGQVSVLGKVLDPIADRAAIMTVLGVLAFRGTIALPLAAAILARDLIVSVVFFFLEARGFPRLAVNFTGKLATSSIFLGLAVAVASTALPGLPAGTLQGFSAGFLLVGAILYWAAGGLYLRDVRRLKAAEAHRLSGRRQP